MIYQGNSFVQLLKGHDRTIDCVEWCSAFGKLVACSEGRLVIYSPVPDSLDYDPAQNMEKAQKSNTSTSWQIDQIIDMENTAIECAAFNVYGNRLIVAGDKLIMYEFVVTESSSAWKRVWETTNATRVCLLEFLTSQSINRSLLS